MAQLVRMDLPTARWPGCSDQLWAWVEKCRPKYRQDALFCRDHLYGPIVDHDPDQSDWPSTSTAENDKEVALQRMLDGHYKDADQDSQCRALLRGAALSPHLSVDHLRNCRGGLRSQMYRAGNVTESRAAVVGYQYLCKFTTTNKTLLLNMCDYVTALYVPSEVAEMSLEISHRIVARWRCDDDRSVDSIDMSLQHMLSTQSQKLREDKMDLADLLERSRIPAPVFRHTRAEQFEWRGREWRRYQLMQPFFPTVSVMFTRVALLVDKETDVLVECGSLDHWARDSMACSKFVLWVDSDPAMAQPCPLLVAHGAVQLIAFDDAAAPDATLMDALNLQ